MIVKMM